MGVEATVPGSETVGRPSTFWAAGPSAAVESLRILTGARAVAFVQCPSGSTGLPPWLVSVSPAGYSQWSNSEGAQQLYSAVLRQAIALAVAASEESELSSLLREQGYEDLLSVPVIAGASLTGVVLVLGVPKERLVPSPQAYLEALSTLVAQSFHASPLFEPPRMEATAATDAVPIAARILQAELSARRQTEEVHQRLYRELRAVSSCNQALVRAESEPALLKEICQIVCEKAGYRMAWVGYALEDESKSIEPVAWAGVEEGYLAGLPITWADTELGKGPTGTAIRCGTTVYTVDMLTSQSFSPWKERARARGYRSSIALPLRGEGGRTFGALTIYSSEPGAFNPDEVRLLEELAGDLAFGIGVLRGRRERSQGEAEREKLQAQLIQAQKLESIGRLAGGVAHDFNNMLAVIAASAELSLMQVEQESQLAQDLQEILRTTERSANLTRQLLAFARKQEICPKALDLNEAIEGTLKMLRRLVRENIELTWHPAVRLSHVWMDPTQVDQLLTNLCLNAGDAIIGAGKIAIETREVSIDTQFCEQNPDASPGVHVLLRVTDDGRGMDSAILARVFEPFFTTKGLGKGTGLGLATVYGIMKQNHGFITVETEPGKGSTFSLYLPRHLLTEVERQPLVPATPTARGMETVLLVEDEAGMLAIVRRMLESLGYEVLAVSTTGDALRLVEEHPAGVQVLLTDVVMPGMNGRELARRLLAWQPRLKCVFMSGYTDDVLAREDPLPEGTHFIHKPFMRRDLAVKLREALDQAPLSYRPSSEFSRAR